MLTQKVFLFLCILFPLTSKAAYQDVATRQQSSFSRNTKIFFGCCAIALLRLCKKINLLSAIQQGDLHTIKLFVRMGGNVNTLINGHHPLVFAAQQHAYIPWVKQIEIIKYLLGQGAYVKATSSDGSSALIEAARSGNYQTLVTLLNAGADNTEHRDRFGCTALLYAVQTAHYYTANGLADILHDYLTCIELLIKHKASIKTPNNGGDTPIGCATIGKIQCIIDALKK